MSLRTVAIIGRPNVGKSSLFNRFIRRRLAVVAEESGVTRDRNYALCEWAGVDFRLVDTGGMVAHSPDHMEKLIYGQAELAIAESDLVLFVVDSRTGIDPTDQKIARLLLKSGCECILAANKVDSDGQQYQIYEFMKLGLQEPHAVSAVTSYGVGDLLDKIVERLPEPPEDDGADDGTIRVALVGRPNVGKSSFINRLVGKERHIVSPIAGTTRDAVDTPFELDGQQYVMVDTAGLRKKHKVHEDIEFYTTLRASRAIDSCDVAIVLVDASAGLTAQDQRIFEQVHQNRRAAVLAVNKWDLIEKDTHTADRFTEQIKDSLAKYAFLPVIYVSALTGQRITKVLSLVKTVYAESCKRIPTPELNDFIEKLTERKHPPARKGKHIKFNYVTQSEVAPPTFVFFVNHPTLVDKAYMSYISNQIRATYGYEGVPFRMKLRKK
jgi:GTP-binding protein